MYMIVAKGAKLRRTCRRFMASSKWDVSPTRGEIWDRGGGYAPPQNNAHYVQKSLNLVHTFVYFCYSDMK